MSSGTQTHARQTDRQTDRKTDRDRDRASSGTQTHARQTARQTETESELWYTDPRQTDRQTETESEFWYTDTRQTVSQPASQPAVQSLGRARDTDRQKYENSRRQTHARSLMTATPAVSTSLRNPTTAR